MTDSQLHEKYPKLFLPKLVDHVKAMKKKIVHRAARRGGYPVGTTASRSRSQSSWELVGSDYSSDGKGAGKGTHDT